MIIKSKSKVMKIGNSLALVLPKIIIDNYGIKKGETLEIGLIDEGLLIPKQILPLEIRLKTNKEESRSPICLP